MIKAIKNYILIFAIFSSSLSWILIGEFYEYGNKERIIGIIALFISIILIIFSYNNDIILKFRSNLSRYVILIITIISCLIIEFPYNIGLIMLTMYLVFCSFKFANKLLLPIIIISIQIGLYNVVLFISPKLKEIPLLNIVIFPFLKLFNRRVSLLESAIFFKGNQISTYLSVSFDKLCGPLMTIFIFTVMIINFLKFINTKKIKEIIFISVIYLFMRIILLFLVYDYIKTTEIFWNKYYIILTFVPLLFILSQSFEITNEFKAFVIFNKKIVTNCMIFVLCISSILVFLSTPPKGILKEGRVLIDEYHSEGWESISEPLDENNFGGQRSVYTYYSFVKLLEKNYEVDIIEKQSDYSKLEKADILILKTPTIRFTDKEILDIRNFVISGGGLLLIGDHTNLFNMNYYLNSICEIWGIKFNYDSVYDLRTGGLTEFRKDNYFTHPINKNLQLYKFATSCSINTNIFSNSVIISRGSCSEQQDLSNVHFFGNMKVDIEDDYGLFTQCVVKQVSQGRICAFSDSTTFSSFSMYMHDNPELVYNIIEYLNRKNNIMYEVLKFILLTGSFITIAVIALKANKRKHIKGHIYIVIILFMFSVTINIVISNFAISYNYSKHIETKLNSIDTVYFVNKNNNMELSHFIGLPGLKPNYSSLFIDFQRKGYTMREARNLEEVTGVSSRAIVIIKPTDEFTKKELKIIQNYINSGGIIIIFDSLNKNEDVSTDELLRYFNIDRLINAISVETNDGEKLLIETINYINYTENNKQDTLTFDRASNIKLYKFIVNNGKFFIITDSDLLANKYIGDPSVSLSQNSIYCNN